MAAANLIQLTREAEQAKAASEAKDKDIAELTEKLNTLEGRIALEHGLLQTTLDTYQASRDAGAKKGQMLASKELELARTKTEQINQLYDPQSAQTTD